MWEPKAVPSPGCLALGSAARGQPCTADALCQAGLACNLRYPAGPVCLPLASVAAGGGCSNSTQCAPPLVCGRGEARPGTDSLTGGFSVLFGRHQLPTARAGTCVMANSLVEGMRCSSSTACAGSLTCGVTGTCTTPQPLGGFCIEHTHCITGLCQPQWTYRNGYYSRLGGAACAAQGLAGEGQVCSTNGNITACSPDLECAVDYPRGGYRPICIRGCKLPGDVVIAETCTSPVGVGGACTTSKECSKGTQCSVADKVCVCASQGRRTECMHPDVALREETKQIPASLGC